jgi:hypothetical protein
MATGSKSRRWLQIFVDVAMLVLFIFLAHPRYTGMGTHAHWSYVLFVLVCVHLVLNKWFFLSLFQGKWPKKRVLMTAINILLLVAILVCYGSIKAIPAHSHLLFMGAPIGLLRLHVIAGWMAILLMGAHLGLHGTLFASSHFAKTLAGRVLGFILKLAALAGCFAVIKINLGERFLGTYKLFTLPVPKPTPHYGGIVLALILVAMIFYNINRSLNVPNNKTEGPSPNVPTYK